MIIIGVDCAAQWTDTGVSIATYRRDSVTIHQAWKGSKDLPHRLGDVLADSKTVLLALDAPLGWPTALGLDLARHAAGQELRAVPDQLFSRETDRFLRTPVSASGEGSAPTRVRCL